MYFMYRWSLALRYLPQFAQKLPVQVSRWNRNYHLHHSHNVCFAMMICFAKKHNTEKTNQTAAYKFKLNGLAGFLVDDAEMKSHLSLDGS